MSAYAATRRLTRVDMEKMKTTGEKIAALTCYDASFARLCSSAGLDVLLVGDSLGMVLQGHDSTLPVTLEQMAYHTAAVVKGSDRPMVVVDMPFGSYQEAPQQAFHNAATLMAAGAQMVKIEGGAEMAQTTAFMSARGIPVCAHIGLTPQSVHQFGGYRIQGKSEAAAIFLMENAMAQQEAGASMLVIEGVPATVAANIAGRLHIPTIGIGASVECSGQVLVLYDILDISLGNKPRFVRNFMHGQTNIAAALETYVKAVKTCTFPGPKHCY